MKNMLLFTKRAGIVFLIFSMLVASVPPAEARKGDETHKETTSKAINRSKQVKSEIRTEVDLAAISNKVKEKSVEATSAFSTPIANDLTAVASTTITSTPYADKIDEAPFAVSSDTESVSTLSGGITVRQTDMVLKGRNGLDFSLTRVYDNNNAQLWGMGQGNNGAPDYKSYPVIVADTFLRQHYAIGTGWNFELPAFEKDDTNSGSSSSSNAKRLRYGGGIYKANGNLYNGGYPWKDHVFLPDTGSAKIGGRSSSYILDSSKDGRKYFFDATGHLLQITDAYGNFIKFYYVANTQYNGDLLSKVENSIGNSMTVQYLSGEVVVTQGNKRVVYKKQLAPGTKDRELLTEVIDAGGRRTVYDYAIKNARFSQFPFTHYDSDNLNPYAMLTGVTHPTGSKSIYQYEDAPMRRFIFEHDNIYSFVDQYRLAFVENRIFNTDGTVDVENHKVISYSGDMGAMYNSTYKFYVTVDDGSSKIEYHYNRDYQKTDEIQMVGDVKKRTAFGYSNAAMDLSPSPTVRVSAMPTVIVTTYERNGLKTRELNGSYWNFYDDYGNVIQTDDSHGYIIPTDVRYHIIQKYQYDSVHHRLITATEPLSATQTRKTEYLLNAQGDTTQMTVKDQSGTIVKQENYEYDAYGNQTVVRIMDNGRVSTTTTEYDAAYQSAYPTKQTTQVTDANGTVSTIVRQFEYDMITGLVTKSIDGNGKATSYQYDALDRPVQKTLPDQNTVTWQFDDLGNRIESTDENGGKSYSQWNPLGWKIESGLVVEGADLAKEKSGYDQTGRKIWAEDALGHRTAYAYDELDRLIQTTYPNGAKETVQYDNMNNTITSTDPDGTALRDTYDRYGRVIQKDLMKSTGPQLLQAMTYDYEKDVTSEKDANGNIKQYGYDVLNRVTSVTDPQGKQTKYAYDMSGNVTQIIDPAGQSVTKQYDELGRLQRKTDGAGQSETFFYDGNNNLTKQMDRKGQTFTFAYNDRNFLLQKSVGSDSVSYEYDATGKRTAMNDGTGRTVYSYTPAGEISVVQYPDGKTISYTYDAGGNRTKMKDPFEREIFYVYDEFHRVKSVSLDSADAKAEASYTYTPGGLLLAEQFGNGMTAEATFNELKKTRTLLLKQADGTVSSSYAYEYDPNGNQTRKTETAVSQNFTYDSLDRMKTSTQFNETYAYDDRGNRQTLQSDQIPIVADGTYEYDAWNRLTKVILSDGTVVAYSYNGDGLLYERSESGTTSRYYYDGDHMIAEANVAAGNVEFTARYVRGNGLALREDAAGSKTYYLHNAHGDVTELRDSNGKILNQYTYDIWGNPQIITEQVSNPFRYSGEYWDTKTSLQYLRSRWYDPSIGRFVSEDTYEGGIANPASLNLYAYVSNNPLRYTDPTGHWQTGDELMSTSAQSEIRYWTNEWIVANRKNDDLSKQRAAAEANQVRSAFWTSRGKQIAETMVPDPYSSFIAGYTTTLGGERVGVRIGNPVTAILTIIGIAIVGDGLGSNKKPTSIFRRGSMSNTNLTPRPQVDVNGLSFNLVPSVGSKYVYTTVEAINATHVLRAVVDGKNHASVRAVDPAQQVEWMNSRNTATTDPYYLTVLLQSLVMQGR